jgi:hypothetical protein
MVEGAVFIGAVVIALVDAIKSLAPGVHGAISVLVAGLVGGALALVDIHIGVADLTVAAGVMAGLAAAGAISVAKRV